MKVGMVIGRISLQRAHPTLVGRRWLLVQPLGLDAIQKQPFDANPALTGEEVVAIDELGAGVGDLIGMSDGAEAAQPYLPAKKPIDVFNCCILDHLDVNAAAIALLRP